MSQDQQYGQIQGVVEKIVNKGKLTALLIDDNWYSTFSGVNGTQEGDMVLVDYKTVVKGDRTYKNITQIDTLTTSTEQASAANGAVNPNQQGPSARDEQITRSVALKGAIENRGQGADPAEVLIIGELFAAFLLERRKTEPKNDEPVEQAEQEGQEKKDREEAKEETEQEQKAKSGSKRRKSSK